MYIESFSTVKKKFYPPGFTRVMSITSGKGGVGKSNVVANLAIALTRIGRSVLILDADLGLANLDVLLGVRPRYTLEHVMSGQRSLKEILVDGPEGISLIPASSGARQLSQLTSQQRSYLMQEIESIGHQYDYLLIDTPAGIGEDVLYFNSSSGEILLVVTPEPTSLTDAYALIKVLVQHYNEKNFSILINNAPSESSARDAYRRLTQVVGRFIQAEIRYYGFIPSDLALKEAVMRQRTVLELFPSSPSGLAMSKAATLIDDDFMSMRLKGGMQFFFRGLLSAMPMTDSSSG